MTVVLRTGAGGVAALVLARLIVVAGGCWAIAGNAWARRLALVIRACR